MAEEKDHSRSHSFLSSWTLVFVNADQQVEEGTTNQRSSFLHSSTLLVLVPVPALKTTRARRSQVEPSKP